MTSDLPRRASETVASTTGFRGPKTGRRRWLGVALPLVMAFGSGRVASAASEGPSAPPVLAPPVVASPALASPVVASPALAPPDLPPAGVEGELTEMPVRLEAPGESPPPPLPTLASPPPFPPPFPSSPLPPSPPPGEPPSGSPPPPRPPSQERRAFGVSLSTFSGSGLTYQQVFASGWGFHVSGFGFSAGSTTLFTLGGACTRELAARDWGSLYGQLALGTRWENNVGIPNNPLFPTLNGLFFDLAPGLGVLVPPYKVEAGFAVAYAADGTLSFVPGVNVGALWWF